MAEQPAGGEYPHGRANRLGKTAERAAHLRPEEGNYYLPVVYTCFRLSNARACSIYFGNHMVFTLLAQALNLTRRGIPVFPLHDMVIARLQQALDAGTGVYVFNTDETTFN